LFFALQVAPQAQILRFYNNLKPFSEKQSRFAADLPDFAG
jgi:hypothetical protein